MPDRLGANRPTSISSSEMPARFLSYSQDEVRWFLQRQVERAERLGVGDMEWVNQLRGCVSRIDAALSEETPPATGTDRRLRVVPPAS